MPHPARGGGYDVTSRILAPGLGWLIASLRHPQSLREEAAQRAVHRRSTVVPPTGQLSIVSRSHRDAAHDDRRVGSNRTDCRLSTGRDHINGVRSRRLRGAVVHEAGPLTSTSETMPGVRPRPPEPSAGDVRGRRSCGSASVNRGAARGRRGSARSSRPRVPGRRTLSSRRQGSSCRPGDRPRRRRRSRRPSATSLERARRELIVDLEVVLAASPRTRRRSAGSPSGRSQTARR